MSTVVAPPEGLTRAEARPKARARTLALAALPLVAIYVAAVLVYGFQAWHHEVPWLFQDELVYASQAREYAATGDLTVRGAPYPDEDMTARITSLAWRFDDPGTDYLAAKLLNVLLMAAACFPAYALARLVVGRPAALFAAAGSVAAPGFVYAAMILTEPVAYLLATTAFWLIARSLAVDRLSFRQLGWVVAALAVSYLAWQVRSQLIILFAVFAAAASLRVLLSETVRRRRLLALAGWPALGAFCYLGYQAQLRRDGYLQLVDGYWDVISRMSVWGFGALAIGLAVVPVVLGLAALWPSRPRRRTAEHVSFSLVALVGVLALLYYTGLKGAYLYFTFATRVIERNLLYATPLLFVGAAIFLQYRRLNPLALAAALAAVGYAVFAVPYQLSFRIYGDAPGLAILSTANRHLQWTDESVRKYVAVMLVVAAAIGLVPYLVRNCALLRLGAAVLGVAMVGATLTAEVAADRSSRGGATLLAENLPKPYDWVFEATGGARTVLIGTAIADPNGVWLTQFFNPNVWYFASLDATAPAPGPNVTPDVVGDDGLLAPQFPDAPYAVVDNKVRIAGDVIRATTYQTLYRIERPLRLVDATWGVMGDDWMGSSAQYYRFSAPRPGPGVIEFTASRAAWGGPDVPGKVTITVSPLRWEGPHDVHLGKMVKGTPHAVERLAIHTRQIVRYLIPVPGPPFLVEVTVEPTFSPADFGLGDRRQLGIQPGFRYIAGYRLPRVVKTTLNPGEPGKR